VIIGEEVQIAPDMKADETVTVGRFHIARGRVSLPPACDEEDIQSI
jgi:hypothetical protein